MSDELEKQTNEIKIAAPLLAPLDIDGMVITADALLTQRAFARHLVEERKAHYHFTVKGNQKILLEDIRYYFAQEHNPPDAVQTDTGHGRIETRNIWVTNKLNGHLNFPHVAQTFMIERTRHSKKDWQNLKRNSLRCNEPGGLCSKPNRATENQSRALVH